MLFDLSKAWFKDRVEGWKMGEPILKEDELLLIYKKPKTAETPKKQIAWDMNLMSIDGFSGDQGWLKIDLKPLYTLHITYENIRRNIQKLTKKKPKTARRLRRKYSERHRNRTKDFLHQLTTMISREFKDYQHGFEDLEKQEIVKKRKGKKRGKRRNREVLVTNWGQIISLMSYKAAEVRLIDPRNSSKICPQMWWWNEAAPKGAGPELRGMRTTHR